MSLEIFDSIVPAGDFPVTLAKYIKTDDGKSLEDALKNVATQLPLFDLGALGLTPISIYGGRGGIETDTTDIIAAFEKGAVAFVIPVDVGGQTANATVVMNPASAMGSYQSIALINFSELATVTVNVGEGMLRVSIVPLVLEQEEEGAVSSTVDLTDFETDGIITETFASGEENIYTFEFDADGKPTRITDSKGNETALTW